ncbi:MAG: alpha/beta hydrolase [Rhodospirillales bacterium]
MFEGFEERRIKTDGAEILVTVGGEGPPLLLLHGYPQTHVMWHRQAEALAKRYRVVCPDLRGYGASSNPPDGDNHSGYSKRAMARDQAEVMSQLGFDRFQVVGHDRGARVTHRLCLDHAERVQKAVVIDICPTLASFEATDQAFATAYYHWFFLIQPAPLPETLIAGGLDAYMDRIFRAWGGGTFDPAAIAAYKAGLSDPDNLHSSCEDYRAAASIDLEHDRADLEARIACPLLVLWGGRSVVGRLFDPLTLWRDRATQVSGRPIDGGHFLPEECPEEVLAALEGFLD